MKAKAAQAEIPLEFISVYRVPGKDKLLYQLLKERPALMNISHQRMPGFAEHCRFVNSKPYREWYFVRRGSRIIGSVYLTQLNEIGMFLFKPFRARGFERQVLKKIIASPPKKRLLVNLSLKNEFYRKIFISLGFKHIQNTYCLDCRPSRRIVR